MISLMFFMLVYTFKNPNTQITYICVKSGWIQKQNPFLVDGWILCAVGFFILTL